jgi:hypothetical protein
MILPSVSPIIHAKLYQGDPHAYRSMPVPATLHVACASELPPSPYSADRVIHFPLSDDPSVAWVSQPAWVRSVRDMGRTCADEVRAGGTVLTTCAEGRNRSGLLSVVTLMWLGFSAQDAIQAVRKGRGPTALTNPRFVEVVLALSPSPRRQGQAPFRGP